jgi:hypothetical protein
MKREEDENGETIKRDGRPAGRRHHDFPSNYHAISFKIGLAGAMEVTA